ncbi:phosphoglycerate mutase-like protein [Annulohypoxylon maeteangense]|uniref:phosphoglycerate mutase-like protein n=1 Tax=Annulohypoxylon maeteangense TaxID=1927788 RepID=UPI002007BD2E|nr:phosphoglycerate mutase-like protein [Annulohypoxylon maeteangense]KAI0882611.1 phosphoglycerate mutase-like protein [Annulohypoxylon maeteangense]
MRILLVRHGESVDNVAGLYAGSRDSPLTNHGVLQTKRLGAHLAKRQETIGPIKYIFTSNLQRAYQTAEAVAEALLETQCPSSDDTSESRTAVEVSRLPELREKDYGSSEGKKYGVKTGRGHNDQIQSDSESHESMRVRAHRFVDSHLVPITDTDASGNITVLIVAHGIILGVLLKVLLERFAPKPAPSAPHSGGQDGLSESVAWSNTGVLQAKLQLGKDLTSSGSPNKAVPVASSTVSDDAAPSTNSRGKPLHLTIELTNDLEHLSGLKKTRGGIGSAKFDSRQRTMDSFFTSTSKKRKL